jgi:hypothetical protein
MSEDYKTTVSKHNPELTKDKLKEIKENVKENRMPDQLKKLVKERFGG